MSNLREDEKRWAELAEKATPGPWAREKPARDNDGWPTGLIVAATARGTCVYASPPGGSFPFNDADFIAVSREAVPTLLSRLEEAREESDEVAPAVDLANTWARESGVPEADGVVGLRDLIDRLWCHYSEKLEEARQQNARVVVEIQDVLREKAEILMEVRAIFDRHCEARDSKDRLPAWAGNHLERILTEYDTP